jgi:hypothetical protein
MSGLGVRVMVFNATFNNISVILWRSDWWRKPQTSRKSPGIRIPEVDTFHKVCRVVYINA